MPVSSNSVASDEIHTTDTDRPLDAETSSDVKQAEQALSGTEEPKSRRRAGISIKCQRSSWSNA